MVEKPILRVESDRGVAVLKLNRPEVMNALNFSLLNALKNEIERLQFDHDVRVVIITGEGERAFCAGADLKERSAMDSLEVKKFISTIRNVFTSIEQLNKPVIAAVNGIALGGGTELALACDIRIASENASMGLTETRLGIIPGAGGTQRLPQAYRSG
jgi:enoyl-CoA hydratase/carnithine racemase